MTILNFNTKYLKILESLQTHLPSERISSIRDLLYHNEGVLGLEIMLDNIDELEIRISRETFGLLEECLKELGYDESRLEGLSSLID